MNPTHELMSRHRSVRSFEPTEIADEFVRRAVSCAQMAATSSNIQGYSLLRVRREPQRKALVKLTGGQDYVAECGAFFVICGDGRRHRLISERAGKPHETNFESFLLLAIDASLFAQNLALAFEADGMGTCFIGGLRNQLAQVAELLSCPRDVYPLFGLCVGVMANDVGPKPRLDVDAILHDGEFPDDSEVLAQVDAYDSRMATYYSERGATGRNWSGAIWRRHVKLKRERLKDTYEALGANFR